MAHQVYRGELATRRMPVKAEPAVKALADTSPPQVVHQLTHELIWTPVLPGHLAVPRKRGPAEDWRDHDRAVAACEVLPCVHTCARIGEELRVGARVVRPRMAVSDYKHTRRRVRHEGCESGVAGHRPYGTRQRAFAAPASRSGLTPRRLLDHKLPGASSPDQLHHSGSVLRSGWRRLRNRREASLCQQSTNSARPR